MATSTKAEDFDVNKFLSNTYITVGVGYKFHEPTITYSDDQNKKHVWDDPYSARIEIGYHFNKYTKFGISHHSQWMTGFPVNDNKEYFKTEIFVDLTFTLADVFN